MLFMHNLLVAVVTTAAQTTARRNHTSYLSFLCSEFNVVWTVRYLTVTGLLQSDTHSRSRPGVFRKN